jgi:hypothetical protein
MARPRKLEDFEIGELVRAPAAGTLGGVFEVVELRCASSTVVLRVIQGRPNPWLADLIQIGVAHLRKIPPLEAIALASLP